MTVYHVPGGTSYCVMSKKDLIRDWNEIILVGKSDVDTYGTMIDVIIDSTRQI